MCALAATSASPQDQTPGRTYPLSFLDSSPYIDLSVPGYQWDVTGTFLFDTGANISGVDGQWLTTSGVVWRSGMPTTVGGTTGNSSVSTAVLESLSLGDGYFVNPSFLVEEGRVHEVAVTEAEALEDRGRDRAVARRPADRRRHATSPDDARGREPLAVHAGDVGARVEEEGPRHVPLIARDREVDVGRAVEEAQRVRAAGGLILGRSRCRRQGTHESADQELAHAPGGAIEEPVSGDERTVSYDDEMGASATPARSVSRIPMSAAPRRAARGQVTAPVGDPTSRGPAPRRAKGISPSGEGAGPRDSPAPPRDSPAPPRDSPAPPRDSPAPPRDSPARARAEPVRASEGPGSASASCARVRPRTRHRRIVMRRAHTSSVLVAAALATGCVF